TTQGEKFDAAGDYVRHWVPELARLPDRYLHAPATAPAAVLRAAGVVLGKDYPQPIVDHAWARSRALAAYASLDRPRVRAGKVKAALGQPQRPRTRASAAGLSR
ncbi:MAG TPA: FAD-binding domain-containing protein, partial [Polyangia bacterium]